MLEDIAGVESCAPLGDRDGYQIVEEASQLPAACREATLLTEKGRRVHIQFLDDAPVYRAIGLGATPRERLPMLLRRQEGQEAVFASVYTLLEAGQESAPCRFERGERRLSVRAGEIVLRLDDEAHVRIHGTRRH